MSKFEYKVVYMDFRGRVSIEGTETFIESDEHRTKFARRVMNGLGDEGWELVSLHQLWPAETGYMIFKREKTSSGATEESRPTERLDDQGPSLTPRGPVQEV